MSLLHQNGQTNTEAEDTDIQYFTITFWNHLKYLKYLCARLFLSFFLFVCLLCSAVYYLPPDWCILPLELEHLLKSAPTLAPLAFYMLLSLLLLRHDCVTLTCPSNADAFSIWHSNGWQDQKKWIGVGGEGGVSAWIWLKGQSLSVTLIDSFDSRWGVTLRTPQ